ncbi:MAG: M48 family metallopeptidase [Ignavibacteriales bacterium]|nr:M48 family metallopeptidase [Ignavibacteriales bacterium]
MDAKKYNRIKIVFSTIKAILSFALLFIFIYFGFSTILENFVIGIADSLYWQFLIFIVLISVGMGIIFFPFNFYIGFLLEHKYKLSNQTFWRWMCENLKGIFVSAVIGIPLLFFFYFVILNSPELWWFYFALVLFFVSIILAKILPVFILPLFYKITPLEDENLKERIIKLSSEVGLKVANVYRFNMSKNTKKANAAFTGLGKTKKILLADTLLEKYTKDEIETVLAHEFGHYKHKHILKNILIGTFSSFVVLYLISLLYSHSVTWLNFSNVSQIAALSMLVLCGMIIGLIQTPISNAISRKFEYQADRYAVQATSKPEHFIQTLEKLTEQNLCDREPHPMVEWFFYSHPSIKNRIKKIDLYIADIKK